MSKSYKFAECKYCGEVQPMKNFYNEGMHHKRKYCNKPECFAAYKQEARLNALENKRIYRERTLSRSPQAQYQRWLRSLPDGGFTNRRLRDKTLYAQELYAMYLAQDGKDIFTGVSLIYGTNSQQRLEVDHIVPVESGGGDELSNLILVTRATNTEKRHLPLDLYLSWKHSGTESKIRAKISAVHATLREQGFDMNGEFRLSGGGVFRSGVI